jgi:hypothetical protein
VHTRIDAAEPNGPTISAPDGRGMILIESRVVDVEDTTYRVVYASPGLEELGP